MLTLGQIRDKYQTPHYNAKNVNSWASRVVYSRLATPIVWLLLHTSVTANQITVFWVALGVFSCLLFTFGAWWISIMAAGLIQLHIVLDYVDGPIARCRRSSMSDSKKGFYIERIGHDLIYTMYFYCISVGLLKKGFDPFMTLSLGFCASIGYFFYKYTRRAKILCTLIYSSKNADNTNAISSDVKQEKGEVKSKNFLRYIYRKSQMIWDPLSFTLLTLAASLFDVLYLLVIFYGLTYPLQFILSYIHQARIKDDWVHAWVKNMD